MQTELGDSTQILRETQARLLERTSARQTLLVDRLSVSQPELRDTGYGIVPDIRLESSDSSPARTEIRYSLATLDARSTDALAEVNSLASDARLNDTDLEALTIRFERARDELANIVGLPPSV